MQQIQRKLGDRIRKLRSRKGWSQEEFAAVSGLHRTYIGAVERGCDAHHISFLSSIS
jgi:transcriptional regulator with XRE-family HTH domain